MARHESDREDLLREATALVERAELRVSGELEPVTAGFRRDGSCSLFFGADPVYQFNAAGELRRAFVAGLLYKAEQGRLVSLRRERTKDQVLLQRDDLDAAATVVFMTAMQARLVRLRTSLEQGTFEALGEVSATPNVPDRICRWLARLPATMLIASRPNVG
jgi:hypothetical protein